MADIGEWVAWLLLPGPARQGRVGVLPSVEPAVSERTLQRKLAAVSAFYGFHRRLDPEITLQLTRWDRGLSSSGYQPFLAHTTPAGSAGGPDPRRSACGAGGDRGRGLPGAARRCTQLRDRFLLPLLRQTAMRIGQALGLRHEDLSTLVVRSRSTLGSTTTARG